MGAEPAAAFCMNIHRKKIKRELLRVVNQFNSWIMNVYEPLIRWQRKRDPARTLNVRINPAHMGSGKVAIYLVFQPHGLEASTLLTLEHLQSKGYSTLLVSNCPLNPEDSARTLPLCWQVMVRKNFGYDFGGYQDGVLTVLRSDQPVKQMLILNDSIWFPLHRDCDLLDRMEASPVGFVGAFQLEPTRDQKKMRGKRRPFMGSFFWHFKDQVLSRPAFKEFWRDYKATSSKFATIRRGERRFTHHLMDAGIACEAVFSRNQFDGWLQHAQGTELRQALEDLCTNDDHLATRRLALLAANQSHPTWEADARALASAITRSQNIMATAPLFMVRDLGLPFLKKSADDANLLALQALNIYFSKRPELIEKAVLNELRQVLQRHQVA